MPYELENRLVIGVASSAVFDLLASDAVFQSQGEEEYRKFQQKNLHVPLPKGIAFPFIKRLLSVNDLSADATDPLVEVILLSRNDPDTGLRVLKTIEHYGLQEFDVVSLRDGIIWNVQCKNNFVDLKSVDSDAVAFARYNRRLVRAYERALMKERNREHLLKMKLDVEPVQHMLVSRFPVVTDNPRIVVFSRIAEFAERADVILAAFECESPRV